MKSVNFSDKFYRSIEILSVEVDCTFLSVIFDEGFRPSSGVVGEVNYQGRTCFDSVCKVKYGSGHFIHGRFFMVAFS